MTCSHSYILQAQRLAQNDLLFTCSKRPDYLSVYYHRSQARQQDKGRWSISEEEEARRFYCAHENENSSDLYPGLWHVEPDSLSIGVDGEVIAFFPAPSNPGALWHGYPFTFSRRAPTARIKALKEVAEGLFKEKKISLSRARKIRTGSV